MKRARQALVPLLLALCLLLSACAGPAVSAPDTDLTNLPAYSGAPYVVLDGNVPDFSQEDLTETAFEHYSPLDALGRCGAAWACVGQELMPTEERGSIGQVKPTGWHTVRYDFVDGKYLYNRCHLIGYQLTGENANERNLITGTRYLNVEGMLPFENLVADYVKETGNHVLYRVTPHFEGTELLARGVELEAMSVEDGGEGVLFHVYAYNVQPGVEIDYATGESALSAPAQAEDGQAVTYILNTGTMRFHDPGCASVEQMKEENKAAFAGTREELLAMGYTPCGQCKP